MVMNMGQPGCRVDMESGLQASPTSILTPIGKRTAPMEVCDTKVGADVIGPQRPTESERLCTQGGLPMRGSEGIPGTGGTYSPLGRGLVLVPLPQTAGRQRGRFAVCPIPEVAPLPCAGSAIIFSSDR
jgi:hypothetical protein